MRTANLWWARTDHESVNPETIKSERIISTITTVSTGSSPRSPTRLYIRTPPRSRYTSLTFVLKRSISVSSKGLELHRNANLTQKQSHVSFTYQDVMRPSCLRLELRKTTRSTRKVTIFPLRQTGVHHDFQVQPSCKTCKKSLSWKQKKNLVPRVLSVVLERRMKRRVWVTTGLREFGFSVGFFLCLLLSIIGPNARSFQLFWEKCKCTKKKTISLYVVAVRSKTSVPKLSLSWCLLFGP